MNKSQSKAVLGAAILLVAAVAGVLASLGQAQPAAAQSVAPREITIEGRGWGHGNGLGQWGALGYAVDHGWSSEQIVDHYYSNTTTATVENRDIRVHLTRNDRRDLLITSRAAFSVTGVDFAPNEVARMRVAGNNRFNVYRTSGCSERGTPLAEGVAGDRATNGDFIEALPANSDYAIDDVSQMLVVIYCDAQSPGTEALRITYRGALGLLEQGQEGFSFNRLPLEQYLRSVVPNEMSPSWGARGNGRGLQALEAQAIAARSWTLVTAEDRKRRGFFTDTCDSTRCQVFSGAQIGGVAKDFGTRFIHSNTAVVNTAGLVRVHADGRFAFTEYSSSSGGWTAGLDEGSNFPGVIDEGDSTPDNPHHTWSTTVRRVDIEVAFPAIGQLTDIEVFKRNGNGAWGGRVRGIRLHGTAGTQTLEFTRWANDIFRRTFSLRSDWYRFPQFAPGARPENDTDSETTEPSSNRPRATGVGLWVAKADGTVLAFGDAQHHGDASDLGLSSPVVSIAALPDGSGYWLATEDGDVRSYGAAAFYGSAKEDNCLKPIVDIAAHPSGEGYWMVDENGGVFAYGAADDLGNGENIEMFRPVHSIESSADGDGYWLADAGGGVYAFGDAPESGSTRGERLPAATAGLASTPQGDGYWLVGADSSIYGFGAARQLGSRAGQSNRRPAADIAVTRSGSGYWIVWDDGTSFPYGDAPDYRTSAAGSGVVAVVSLGS